MTSPRVHASLLALALLALTGCGSTVQVTGSQAAGDGLTAPSGAVSGLVDGSTGTATTTAGTGTGAAPRNGAPVQGTTTTTRTGTTTSSTAAANPVAGGATTVKDVAASVPEKGKGWDKSFVYVGVLTQKDVNAVAKGLGAKSIDGGDQEGEANAVADEINARGGVFGRKLKVVFHDLATVDTAANPENAGVAACTFFTQDQPVIAVLNPSTPVDVPNFRSCLAKAHVALFSASVASVDSQVGKALSPYFYQSVAPSWDALAPVMVSSLKQQGYFKGWNPTTGKPGTAAPKVAVLTGTDSVDLRVGRLIVQNLKQAGYGSAFTFAGNANDQQSAVLKMSGSGVTHLILADLDQDAFMTTAHQQKYHPRYGISTYDAPQAFLEANGPFDQVYGSMGVGWSPSLDVSDANDPGDTGPAETQCKAVLKKAGFTFSGKRLAEAIAFAYCDGLNLIAEGAKAGGGLTGVLIHDGIVRIAPSFRSAFGFTNGLTATRLFIPGAVRPLAYVAACNCFRYTSTKDLRL